MSFNILARMEALHKEKQDRIREKDETIAEFQKKYPHVATNYIYGLYNEVLGIKATDEF